MLGLFRRSQLALLLFTIYGTGRAGVEVEVETLI